MVMPNASSSPQRKGGTIASRYLEAISCGGHDLAAFTVPSGARCTPERRRHSMSRVGLNDSCGQTAPTAALDSSTSWTSLDTRSRSDAASRKSTGLNSHAFPADTAYSTTSGEGPLGIEDECSSIESSSSHQHSGRPAHLSVDMENSIFDKSFEDDSYPSSPIAGAGSPSPLLLRTPEQSAERRHHTSVGHNPWPRSQEPRGYSNGFSFSGSGTAFPKTNPRSPLRRPMASDPPAPFPHEMPPVRTPNRSAESVYLARRMENLNSFRARQPIPAVDQDAVDSEAGAPTEIMANLSRGMLKGDPPPPRYYPPPIRRWMPPKTASGNVGQMQSLFDEMSTNEESATYSQDLRMQTEALFDARSSSFSTDGGGQLDEPDMGMASSNHSGNPWLQKPRNTILPNDSDPIGAGNVWGSALKAEAGAEESVGRKIYGGRSIGGRSLLRGRLKPTARGHNTNAPPTQSQVGPDDELPAKSPLRFYMKEDDPMPQPRSPQPASSGELTSSVSATDALLIPDVTDGTKKASTFIRYNARQTPNAHEVFQRRFSDSSNASTLSTSDKTPVNALANPTDNPIQPLFSLDRLDFSYDSQSPLRKFRSQSHDWDKPGSPKVLTRSKSMDSPPTREVVLEKEPQDPVGRAEKPNFEGFQVDRFAVEKQPRTEDAKPDPIFCRGPQSFGSREGESALSSSLSGDSVGDVKRVDSTSTGHDTELVHILNTSQEQNLVEPRRSHSTSLSRTDGARVLPPQNVTPSTTTAPNSSVASRRLQDSPTIVPPKRQSSVKEMIQAFNMAQRTGHQTQVTSSTSRQSLIMGAHIAAMASEEKKDDGNTEGLSLYRNDHSRPDDDDSGSVKSLRDFFEGRTSQSYYPEDEEDDNSSFQSLKERLERQIKAGYGHDDSGDDEGSVRSLRELFEGRKKRLSGAVVSQLRSRFEPEKTSPKFLKRRNDSRIASVTRSSPVAPASTAPAHETQRKLLPQVVHPTPSDGKETQQSQHIAEPPAFVSHPRRASEPTPDESFGIHANPQPEKTDCSHSSAPPTAQYLNHIASTSFEKSERTEVNNSRGSMDKYIQRTSTDQTEKATGGSVEKCEDDTISTHSSRVRGPTPTAFLAMKERLLKFSGSPSATPAAAHAPQKMTAPPTMQQRLNRWANRHQAAKQAPLESQNERIAKSNTNHISESAGASSYDPSLLHDVKHKEIPPKQATAAGFFKKTNQSVREKRHDGERRQAQDPGPETGREIFRKDGQKGSSVELSNPATPGARWVWEDQAPQGQLSRNDSKSRSTDTENTDGVTLDPSIADISILTDPTLIHAKGSKDFEFQYNMAPKLSTNQSLETLTTSNAGEVDAEIASFLGSDSRNTDISTPPKPISSARVEDKRVEEATESGWDIEHIAKSFSFASSGITIEGDSESAEDPFDGIEWPAVDDDNWTDFSKVKNLRNGVAAFPPSPMQRPSHSTAEQQRAPLTADRATPPAPAAPASRSVTETAHDGHRPVSGSVGSDTGSFLTGFSDLTPLPPVPSPYDKDYDLLMETRHMMLLSRQRAHQERKASREKGINRSDIPAEPPGLQVAEFDLSAPPRTPVSGGFFGRTHPAVKGPAPVLAPPPAAAAPPSKPGGILKGSSKYSEAQTTHPKKQLEVQYPNSSEPSTPPRKNTPRKTHGNPSTSFFAKITESIGLSSISSTRPTKNDSLVARLKSVKAARIRRRHTNRRVASHQALVDDDLDEGPLVAVGHSSSLYESLPRLNRPIQEQVSSHRDAPNETIQRLVGVVPPPPPMSPPRRVTGRPADPPARMHGFDGIERGSSSSHFFEDLLEVD